MSNVKYPDVEVQLIGGSGNAFVIIGATKEALRKHGVPASEIKQYVDEATSGDYDHLLQTTMKWVNVG